VCVYVFCSRFYLSHTNAWLYNIIGDDAALRRKRVGRGGGTRVGLAVGVIDGASESWQFADAVPADCRIFSDFEAALRT